jgi:predicted GH43/DUF377 family glycosyl hydrolase
MIEAADKLRGSRIYINEHLTRKNGAIAKRARELRKAGKIAKTNVRDCKVFVKDLSGKSFVVHNITQLDGY